MRTKYVGGLEVRAGDTVINGGRPRLVTFAIQEGDRNLLSFRSGPDVVVMETDRVEMRCGDGMEEYDDE